MSTELYRKYIDIINENSEPNVLNEGIIDALKLAVPKAINFLGHDVMQAVGQKVREILGGDFTPSKENAIKVAKALGFEQALQQNNQDPMNEGIAGNWQGKLIQLLHGAGLVGTAVSAAFANIGNPLVGVGLILILIAGTIYGDERGQVGAMGKYGNKGFETGKGPDRL